MTANTPKAYSILKIGHKKIQTGHSPKRGPEWDNIYQTAPKGRMNPRHNYISQHKAGNDGPAGHLNTALTT